MAFWHWKSITKRRLIFFIKTLSLIIFATYIFLNLSIIKSDFNKVDGINKLLKESIKSSSSLKQIKQLIDDINKQEFVFNRDKFDTLKENDLIFVVQVHNRIDYLKALIDSLNQVQNIEQVLLIFSHDWYNDKINKLISSITFCKVIQIFYPYSIQLYPNVFPGTDPNDCLRDIKKEIARKLKCNNALYPDSFGHYREAHIVQTKHHWTWKINFVIDHMKITKKHTGSYLLLEDDFYLVSDIIHVIKLMLELRKKYPLVELLTLGSFDKSVNFGKFGNHVSIKKWDRNMGLVIDRKIWHKIKTCAEKFCTFDDYNWDWTLQYISAKCLPVPLKTIAITQTRIFHIGECGLHHSKNNCSSQELIEKIQSINLASKKYMYPSHLVVKNSTKIVSLDFKLNGGWSDVRDHQLCFKNIN